MQVLPEIFRHDFPYIVRDGVYRVRRQDRSFCEIDGLYFRIIDFRDFFLAGILFCQREFPPILPELENKIVDRKDCFRLAEYFRAFVVCPYEMRDQPRVPVMAMDYVGFEFQKRYELDRGQVESEKSFILMSGAVNAFSLGKIFFVFSEIYRQAIHQLSLPKIESDRIFAVQSDFYVFINQFQPVFFLVDDRPKGVMTTMS